MTLEPPENAIHSLTRAEGRAWLHTHHTREAGVWLITYQKSHGQAAYR
jgi:hypothetical protein